MAQRLKVLVTDDDGSILELNSSLLRKAGYEVFEATTGEECLQMVRSHHPDLIVLDVMLPDMRGTTPRISALGFRMVRKWSGQSPGHVGPRSPRDPEGLSAT